jgi:uncharacterized protein YjbI with pentapeptide repeats
MGKVREILGNAAEKLQATLAEKLKDSLAEVAKVTIVNKKLTQEELAQFVTYVAALSPEQRSQGVSLTSYVKNTFYPDQKDYVVIPDLTGLELNSTGERIDLKGVDFTGSTLSEVKIENCDLTDAVFCECDMNDIYLDNSTLVNTDFRGAIVVGAILGKSYDFIDRRIQAERAVEEKYFQFAVADQMERGITGISTADPDIIEARERNKKAELEAIAEKFEKEQQELVGGIKLDTTHELAISYQEHLKRLDLPGKIKSELDLLVAEKTKKLEEGIAPLNKAVSDLGVSGRLTHFFTSSIIQSDLLTALTTGGMYEDLESAKAKNAKELEEFRAKAEVEVEERNLPFRKNSFLKVFSQFADCDPCYQRGSSPEERNKKRQYIDTSVEDVKSYLEQIKQDGKETLTLNELVRTNYNQANPENPITEDTIVHADCSSKGGVKDFSGIHFNKAHLQGVSFAGSKLSRAKFTETNISDSSFESSDMAEANFQNVTARGTNFFHANLTKTQASDSDFTGAVMMKSDASNTNMTRVKLGHVKGRFANLDGAKISNSNADGADFTSASLINAQIQETSMIGIKLDKAVLDHCKMTGCNLKEASLEGVRAHYAEFKRTTLEGIKAQKADFLEAHFDELCTLDKADLQNAVMAKVKLNGVSLKGAQMQFVDLRDAKMEDAIVEGAQMQFADLTGAFAKGLKASGVDMTGATLKGMKAARANFKGAILQDVKAEGAKFQEAMMEEANLLGADFANAILEKAKMKGAKVNAHTNFAGVNDDTIEGKNDLREVVRGEDGKYTETKISMDEQKRKNELFRDAQSRGVIQKAAGSVVEGTGGLIEAVGEFVKQPFSDKTGLRVGIIVGVVIALCVVASIAAPLIPGAFLVTPFINTALAIANLIPGVSILTSTIALATIPAKILAATITATAPALFTAVGISVSATAVPILATATAAVVTTVTSVAAGALAGRYAVKHIKATHVAAASTGFGVGIVYGAFLGPLAPLVGIMGAAAGVFSAVTVNATSQKVFSGITGGRTIDDLVSSGIGWVGSRFKDFGQSMGITPEQAELLKQGAKHQSADGKEYAKILENNKEAQSAAKGDTETVYLKALSPQQRMALEAGKIPHQFQVVAQQAVPSRAAERVEGAPKPSIEVSSDQPLQEAASGNTKVARDDQPVGPRQDPSQAAMPEGAASVKEPGAEAQGPFASKEQQKRDQAAQKKHAPEVKVEPKAPPHQKIASNPPAKSNAAKVAAEQPAEREAGK